MLLAAADFLGRRPNANQDEIAKAVGVGRATLHRHFPGRAALVQAVSDMAGQKMYAAVETSALDQGDCVSAVRRLVAALEDNAPYLALLHTLSQDLDPDLEDPVWDDIDQAVTSLFERGQASGEFTPLLSAAWMSEALYSLVAGAAWAIQSGRCAQQDFTPMVTSMVLTGTTHHRNDGQ
ncbi:TetR/AcrR family transcriptional regulator [Streptomonospora salina]